MKYLLIYSVVMIFSINLFAQDDNLISQSIHVIGSSFIIKEMNPMEKTESDSINSILQSSLKRHLELQLGSLNDILDIFNLLYKNGESLYSDTSEEIRMKLRRSACFASIALLSDTERGLTFIEYAKIALSSDLNDPKIEFIEEPYLGVLFIELMLKYEDNLLNKQDLEKVSEFIQLCRDNLSVDITNRATSLLKAYKERL